MRYSTYAIAYLLAIAAIPLLLAALPVVLLGGTGSNIVALLVAVPIYVLSYGLLAGLLSRPHQRWIQAGKFPRDLASELYAGRRLYGLCWTAVYYFHWIYWLWLSFPYGKHILFRLFGYSGNTNFTTYPDTWIRDLPVLEIENGAYLSNRATVGTNIVLADGSILVDQIRIGRESIIGHLAMLAPGVWIGDNVEVGVGCAIGIKSRLEDRVEIGPTSTIEHGVVIGAGTKVGTYSFIGSGTKIAGGLKIPPGSIIPRGASIQSQADLALV